MRTLWATSFGLGLVAGCGPKPLTETQQAAIMDSVGRVVQSVFEATNRRDAVAVLSAYVDDAVMANNGVIYSTKESYRKALDSVWLSLDSIQARTLPLRSRILGPDVAVTMVPFTLTVTAKTGRQTASQGVYTALLQRRGGTWRILRSHESEQHRDQLLEQVRPKRR